MIRRRRAGRKRSGWTERRPKGGRDKEDVGWFCFATAQGDADELLIKTEQAVDVGKCHSQLFWCRQDVQAVTSRYSLSVLCLFFSVSLDHFSPLAKESFTGSKG